MHDDELTDLLKRDHLAAQDNLADDDFADAVLRRVAKRSRRRASILNAAALAGAAIATSQIPALINQGPVTAVYGPLLVASLVIAGTAISFGWAMSR